MIWIFLISTLFIVAFVFEKHFANLDKRIRGGFLEESVFTQKIKMLDKKWIEKRKAIEMSKKQESKASKKAKLLALMKGRIESERLREKYVNSKRKSLSKLRVRASMRHLA